MFQRRSDLQIMRVLRGISHEDALELTDATQLLNLADNNCEFARTLDAFFSSNVTRCTQTKRGICGQRPKSTCHLKRHTELLKRYGHFGKMPTSAALMLREQGVSDLPSLRAQIWELTGGPSRASHRSWERAISRTWRVSEKIAAMYLRPSRTEICPGTSRRGPTAWTAITSLSSTATSISFLRAIDYRGPMTYRARRVFYPIARSTY